MKRKITAVHGGVITFLIMIIVAATIVYIANESEYKNINASDINDNIGKKVKVKLTPIEEIEIVSIDGYEYRCKENNVTISSNDSLELDKIIMVRGEVKEYEGRIILFVE